MKTNADFESFTLTKHEKRLLRKIRRKGHIDYTDEANSLFKVGLVAIGGKMRSDDGNSFPREHVVIVLHPEYERYRQYCINRFIRSTFTPAVISGVVSLIVSVITALLTLLLG